jgi:hypothetical protein
VRTAAEALAVRRRSATVTAVDLPTGTATITIGADTTAIAGVPALASYRPAAGDVVALDLVAGSPVLIGRVGAPDTDMLEFQPAGNTDTGTSGTFATWINLGNVQVPAWATGARYDVTVSGVYAITASPTGLTLRLAVGGVGATKSVGATAIDSTNSPRTDRTWKGRITGLTAGPQSVIIQYTKGVGTGAFRADTSSLITVDFGWET